MPRSLSPQMRQIEGTINKILAYKDLLGDNVDEEAVKRAIRDILSKSGEVLPTPETIITYVCRVYNIEENVIRGQQRVKDAVQGRQIAMYLIRRMTNLSLVDIGREFGGRDHATVKHSIEKVEKQIRTDPSFAEVIKELTTNINSKT